MENIKKALEIETRVVKVGGDYIREAKATYEDGVYYCAMQLKPSLRYSAYNASYADYLTGLLGEEPELIEECNAYPDNSRFAEAYSALIDMPKSDEQRDEVNKRGIEGFEAPTTDEYEAIRIVSQHEGLMAPDFNMNQIEIEYRSKVTGKTIFCACESLYGHMSVAPSRISDNKEPTYFLDACEGLENAVGSEYYEVYYKTYKTLMQ